MLGLKIFNKFRKTRTIFLSLIVLFIVFVIVNQIFISLITHNDKSDADKQNRLSSDALNQISAIQKRIEKLQDSIDLSNKNAQNLNLLIDKANVQVPVNLNNINANKLAEIGIKHNDKIAILVFSCNRPGAIRNHLDQLINIRKTTVDIEKFPIIVSQDCGHADTEKAINGYSDHLYDYVKQPDLSDITVDKKTGKKIPQHLKGYFKIARHYKWALEEIFIRHEFQWVILNEDDLNMSPDFLNYFEAMQKVLAKDKSLFCASAWNDNGKSNLINSDDLERVYRTDFFPGLGWMMQRSLWMEFRDKWPFGFWDDWIREPENRKDRACLRPEISRTEMSNAEAKKGVSQGQFLDKFLKLISMNHQPLEWSTINTDYLLKENYDKKYADDVYMKTVEISFKDFLKPNQTINSNRILITYSTKQEFLKYGNYFGIMNDFKAGVPRTAYQGIVQIYYKSKIIFIAPKAKMKWQNYQKDW